MGLLHQQGDVVLNACTGALVQPLQAPGVALLLRHFRRSAKLADDSAHVSTAHWRTLLGQEYGAREVAVPPHVVQKLLLQPIWNVQNLLVPAGGDCQFARLYRFDGDFL